MKKYYSRIALLLIFLITVYPLNQVLAKPTHPLRIGVVAITDLSEDEIRLSQELHSQLNEQGFSVIGPQEINKIIQTLSGTQHQKSLTIMSNQAQDDYFQGNFYSASQASLEKLLKAINNSQGTCGDEKPLALSSVIDAYLTMGLIHLAQKQTKKAYQDFNQAHTLNPHLSLSDVQYSPSVIQFYNQVVKNTLGNETKEVISDQKVKVKQVALITSQPGNAEVFIDGQLKGRTPFKLSRNDSNSHIITIQKDGWAPYCQTILGSTEKYPDILATLGVTNVDTAANAVSKPFNKAELAHNVSQTSLFSNLLTADQLILLGHLPSVKTKKQVLTAQIYQAHSSFLGSIHVLERSGDIAQQTAQIVSQLKVTPYAGLSEDVAETKTAADHVPEKPAQKKSHSGKSILYIVGGIVVAGAAAGIALGMGGGGGGGGSGGGAGATPQSADSSSVSVNAPQPQ